MEDTAKYLIHADVTAEGVVERNDVVGAVFGQTEGLLGDDLDLRTLQQSSKVGRIDVTINSKNGQSFGYITIASGLDRVETAILAASLETIDRIGPCRSTVDVDRIEDVRAAKRREVVERARSLLGAFEDGMMSSAELVELVRESARAGDVVTYEGLPAGPRVADGDAIIVVEGRADVLTLLRYGVKNAIAVEGTNVPESVATLTAERTTTAFLDGDRGGDLILKELAQVGEVDYVAYAPAGESVEDLGREVALTALREKVPYDVVAGAKSPREAVAATDGSARPAPVTDATVAEIDETDGTVETAGPAAAETAGSVESADAADPVGPTADESNASRPDDATEASEESEPADADTGDIDAEGKETEPETLAGHVRAVIEAETGRARLLDSEFGALSDVPAEETFDALAEGPVPIAVVLDGTVTQRILDVAAQRGVEQVVASDTGEFVKKPTGVRVRTAAQLRPEGESTTEARSG